LEIFVLTSQLRKFALGVAFALTLAGSAFAQVTKSDAPSAA
jgi:hypothetical protein